MIQRHAHLGLGIVMLLAVASFAHPASAGAQAAARADTTAQDSTPIRKSGTVATVYSMFLPGAGHLYAQDYRRGGILLGLFATGVALGAVGENAVTPVGLLLAGAPWWYGVLTAHSAVGRYNRRIEAGLALAPPTGSRERGGLAGSLAIRVSITT